MTIQDKFDFELAYNPATNILVPGAEFEVYAVDDTTFTTPLALFDPDSGATIDPLVSSSVGVLPQFAVDGNPTQVVIKSGAFATLLTSRYAALQEAGWNVELAQAAVAAGNSITTSVQQARDAQAAAEIAAAAAAAIPAQIDSAMVTIAEDPDSDFGDLLETKIEDGILSRVDQFQGEPGTSFTIRRITLATHIAEGGAGSSDPFVVTAVFPNGTVL